MSESAQTGTVEFIPRALVAACRERIQRVRERTGARIGAVPPRFDPHYWEAWFEANAEELLRSFPEVELRSGYSVRYRCFGQHGADLRVRPFVARAGVAVDSVQRILEWHAPPDSRGALEKGAPNQDVELLYSHFSFPRTAAGYFEYWFVMQEIWASARWAYSHVVADLEELGQLVAGPQWQLIHPVEQYQPAVVRSENCGVLAVLVHCPLQRFEVTLQRVEIDAQQALHYSEPILVASGPRGYIL
ncbi:MAG: hypothetical protein KatS3mg077_2538 [Candidatus Binatia bacterium]|nr:MAG: hypothetical protein KatS3mg077_2538 [Candidatus Binatia bacterium]